MQPTRTEGGGFVPVRVAYGNTTWIRRPDPPSKADPEPEVAALVLTNPPSEEVSVVAEAAPTFPGALKDALVVWLRADEVIVNDSLFVAQCGDKSGQKHDFTRGSSSGFTYAEAVQQVHCLRGNPDRSSRLSCDWELSSKETSIFIACTTTPHPSYFYSSGRNGCRVTENSTGKRLEYVNGYGTAIDRHVFSDEPSPGMHIMAVVQKDGEHLTGYLDGNRVFAAKPTVACNAVTTIGNYHSDKRLGTTGDFIEFLQFNRALSAEEADLVHQHLRAASLPHVQAAASP